MNYEDPTPTRHDTNELWIRFSSNVLNGDDGFTAMNKAIESEGWIKTDRSAA